LLERLSALSPEALQNLQDAIDIIFLQKRLGPSSLGKEPGRAGGRKLLLSGGKYGLRKEAIKLNLRLGNHQAAFNAANAEKIRHYNKRMDWTDALQAKNANRDLFHHNYANTRFRVSRQRMREKKDKHARRYAKMHSLETQALAGGAQAPQIVLGGGLG